MVTTPRKEYFTVPTSEDEIALLSPTQIQTLLNDENKNEVDSSILSSNSNILNDQPVRYKDQGKISKLTIISTFLFSILSLSLLLYYTKSPSISTLSESPLDTTIQTPFAFTPTQLANQCHNYYSLEKMPDHSGRYLTSGSQDEEEKWTEGEGQEEDVCEKTLTYLLDGEVGLFYHLLLIAQSYSIAKLSNRTFFIDDSAWDRGKWVDHFISLPSTTSLNLETGCRRPDSNMMKGCPRGTRHWVVSPATARYHFAHQYQAYFEDPKGHDVGRKKKMFQMARDAFDEILIPSNENLKLIEQAAGVLKDNKNSSWKDYVGVHIRRGDRRPMTWKYRNGYIPIENFVEAINRTLSIKSSNIIEESNPTIFISTDTPSILSIISKLSPPSYTYLSLDNSTDSNISSLASPYSYDQSSWSTNFTSTEKISYTRGMIIDFSLLTGGWANTEKRGEVELRRPKSLICGVNSNICKLAAVALGWENSFEQKRWINVDGGDDFDWRPTDVAG